MYLMIILTMIVKENDNEHDSDDRDDGSDGDDDNDDNDDEKDGRCGVNASLLKVAG